jgi:HEAT repeat protein
MKLSRRGAFLLFAGLAAVLAAGAAIVYPHLRGESERDLKRWLLSHQVSERAQIRILAERGVPYLRKLLKSEERIIRDSAILALGERKGDQEAVKLLVELCDADDADDAYWAIISLARQGVAEAKGLIQRLAQSGEARVREAAAIAIRQLGDESLYPLLDKLTEDKHPVVKRAAQAMRRYIQGSAPKQGGTPDSP